MLRFTALSARLVLVSPVSLSYNGPTLLVLQSTAAATVKAEAPKVDPPKTSTSTPAAVAEVTVVNVSVQEKKDEAKPSQTKVEPPTLQQEAVNLRPACFLSPVDILVSLFRHVGASQLTPLCDALQVEAPPAAAPAKKEVKKKNST